MDHDYGFAPNPFHGVLSLATCKGSQLRNNGNLEIGDWVIGLGSVAMGNLGKIIYAMQLEEKITFDQYWEDPRFQNKKPVINGTLVQMYGDMAMVEIVEPKVANKMVTVRIADLKLVEVHF